MNFGVIYMLGIDLQQVSIATLIIALGLLVDDPVVAGDAIKNDMAAGHPPLIAAWLGPSKLAKAILYATVTNIIAYLPFPPAYREHGLFSLQPAHRDGQRPGVLAAGLDDVYSSVGILLAASPQEAGSLH